MSYQVLARKWRPRTFSEMVGQQHVLKALTNALDQGRVHHAFLFTGTRGVGKTTVARVFAKALNCLEGISSEPCGKCDACVSIDEGRFLDLIEVDAASRTRVDETRELLDNVQYAPTIGRYKVYLIDEVHMLSAHSFNALLKTLEEPPPHVKFLLATTDPQKLPVTVLSRCLQFNLKRLSETQISEYLADLLGREEVSFDKLALTELAVSADGSMRDALSLTDQAIAYGGGEVRDQGVRDMLGTIDRSMVLDLLRALNGGDAAELLGLVDQLDERAPDYAAVLDELASQLQKLAVNQLAPREPDAENPLELALATLAGETQPEDVQLWYQLALHGKRDLPLAPNARGGFEMAMLRMLLFKPAGTETAAKPSLPAAKPAATVNVKVPAHQPAPQPAAAPPPPARPSAEPAKDSSPPPWSDAPAPEAASSAAPQPVAQPASPPVQSLVPPPREPAPAPAPQAAASLPTGGDVDWAGMVPQMGLRGMSQQLASHCLWGGRDGKKLVLQLDPASVHMLTERSQLVLETALRQHFNEPDLKLDIQTAGDQTAPLMSRTLASQDARAADARQQAAVESIESDPIVQALKRTFDATVRPGSIKPTGS